RIEDSREFNGDVPATDDRHALRPVFQFEKTVGGKTEFRARYLRYQRFAACRYHYSVGAVVASVDIYGLVVQETRRTADQVDTAPLEVAGIDVVEPRDIAVARMLQLQPVMAVVATVESLVPVVFDVVGVVGVVPLPLFRDAAVIDAGSA